MKTDITTKLLLAVIAVGLFANAWVGLTENVEAYGHRKYNAVLIAGKAIGQDRSPIAVHCTNCN